MDELRQGANALMAKYLPAVDPSDEKTREILRKMRDEVVGKDTLEEALEYLLNDGMNPGIGRCLWLEATKKKWFYRLTWLYENKIPGYEYSAIDYVVHDEDSCDHDTPAMKAIKEARETGDLTMLRFFCEKCPDVIHQDKYLLDALLQLEECHFAVLDLLNKHGKITENICDSDKIINLWSAAIMMEKFSLLEWLHKHYPQGAKNPKYNIWHQAVLNRNIKALDWLCKNKIFLKGIQLSNNGGDNVWHIAIASGGVNVDDHPHDCPGISSCVEVLDWLCEHKVAGCEATTAGKQTVWHIAAVYDNPDALDWLESHRIPGRDKVTENGYNLWLSAALHLSINALQWLKDHNEPGVNARAHKKGGNNIWSVGLSCSGHCQHLYDTKESRVYTSLKWLINNIQLGGWYSGFESPRSTIVFLHKLIHDMYSELPNVREALIKLLNDNGMTLELCERTHAVKLLLDELLDAKVKYDIAFIADKKCPQIINFDADKTLKLRIPGEQITEFMKKYNIICQQMRAASFFEVINKIFKDFKKAPEEYVSKIQGFIECSFRESQLYADIQERQAKEAQEIKLNLVHSALDKVILHSAGKQSVAFEVIILSDGVVTISVKSDSIVFHIPDGEIKDRETSFEYEAEKFVAAFNALKIKAEVGRDYFEKRVCSIVRDCYQNSSDYERAISEKNKQEEQKKLVVKEKTIIDGYKQRLSSFRKTHEHLVPLVSDIKQRMISVQMAPEVVKNNFLKRIENILQIKDEFSSNLESLESSLELIDDNIQQWQSELDSGVLPETKFEQAIHELFDNIEVGKEVRKEHKTLVDLLDVLEGEMRPEILQAEKVATRTAARQQRQQEQRVKRLAEEEKRRSEQVARERAEADRRTAVLNERQQREAKKVAEIEATLQARKEAEERIQGKPFTRVEIKKALPEAKAISNLLEKIKLLKTANEVSDYLFCVGVVPVIKALVSLLADFDRKQKLLNFLEIQSFENFVTQPKNIETIRHLSNFFTVANENDVSNLVASLQKKITRDTYHFHILKKFNKPKKVHVITKDEFNECLKKLASDLYNYKAQFAGENLDEVQIIISSQALFYVDARYQQVVDACRGEQFGVLCFNIDKKQEKMFTNIHKLAAQYSKHPSDVDPDRVAKVINNFLARYYEAPIKHFCVGRTSTISIITRAT